MRSLIRALTPVALLAALAGCDVGLPAGRMPHREGNRLDMIDQPKLKPQRKDIFGSRPTGLMEPQPGTVAIGEAGAANAGLFAVSLLATSDAALADKLAAFRQKQADKVMGMTLEGEA